MYITEVVFFRKPMKNATKLALLALWQLRGFWVKNHRKLTKIAEKWKYTINPSFKVLFAIRVIIVW